MIRIELGQALSAHSARHGRHVVNVGLLDHGGHCLLDAAVGEFVVGVFLPDLFKVKVGAVEERFQEGEGARVRDGGGAGVVALVGGDGEVGVSWGDVGVGVGLCGFIGG